MEEVFFLEGPNTGKTCVSVCVCFSQYVYMFMNTFDLHAVEYDCLGREYDDLREESKRLSGRLRGFSEVFPSGWQG